MSRPPGPSPRPSTMCEYAKSAVLELTGKDAKLSACNLFRRTPNGVVPPLNPPNMACGVIVVHPPKDHTSVNVPSDPGAPNSAPHVGPPSTAGEARNTTGAVSVAFSLTKPGKKLIHTTLSARSAASSASPPPALNDGSGRRSTTTP